MARKSNKSSSSNCSRKAAKKNIPATLEWSRVASGALRGIRIFVSVYRAIELMKTFLEQSNLFG